MSVCIIGAGLSGLASAIKIKLENPSQHVLVIEKKHPESNTQISGQRYRSRISGSADTSGKELVELLVRNNEGIRLPQMETFVGLSLSELDFWRNIATSDGQCMVYEDKPEWFGPRLGLANNIRGGRGLSVLSWYHKLAEESGVEFVTGETISLLHGRHAIDGIVLKPGLGETSRPHVVRADCYVLAGGSIGGSLFLSTNKVIHYSPQELATNAGLTLIDGSVHMIHPFGHCGADGSPRLGCYETDELDTVSVYLGDGTFDEQTTQLLQAHKAHYAFREIAERFIKAGSMATLVFPDGRSEQACVSHHYSQLGVETDDGIKAKGVDNLFVVGDASSIGYWTGHRIRLPGMALTKCLVDARLIGQAMRAVSPDPYMLEDNKDEVPTDIAYSAEQRRQLQEINTQYLMQMMFAQSRDIKNDLGEKWVSGLLPYSSSSLGRLSIGVANANWKTGIGEQREPFPISFEKTSQLLLEGHTTAAKEVYTPLHQRL